MRATRALKAGFLALLVAACSSSATPLEAGAVRMSPAHSNKPDQASALPIETVTANCVGEPSERVAVLSVPNGRAFWAVFPDAGEFPELEASEVPTIAVIYKDGWPGPLLQRVGSDARTPKPGTWDVCLEVQDASATILGQPYIVLGGIRQASASLPSQ